MQVLCAFCVFSVIREKKDVQVMSVSESKFISLYALRLYVQTAGDFGGKCGQMTGKFIHAMAPVVSFSKMLLQLYI